MVCDQPPPGEDMCIEQAEDTLSVRRVSPGTLAVTIELVQTNGHTCTFDEKLRHAKTSQPDSQRWTFSSSDEDSPCTLDLVEQGGHISISSNGCRDYCGVRATLDAQFDTASSCAATTVQ